MIGPQKARAEVSPGPECPSYAWQVEHVPHARSREGCYLGDFGPQARPNQSDPG